MFGIPDEYVPSLIALAGALFTGLVGLATGLRKSDSRRARLERDTALLEQIPDSAARTRLLKTIDWQIGEIHEVDKHGERDWLGALYVVLIAGTFLPFVWTTLRDDNPGVWRALLAIFMLLLVAGFVLAAIGGLQKKPYYQRRNVLIETGSLLVRWMLPSVAENRRRRRLAETKPNA
ncbi:hypothetical protein [Aeromicrobium sp. IC_218]|uniref:hypothetical protein n=1 Tax=Aeromicrobium sp. IC_218 TaxID=2545468 RepID=UPI00103CF138|nr:hypothetical protein [Aeromicrobium sp. IC_218]TCI98832.1 hypothetical protein E0W78_08750 [Aeromicrobium sp. IC_218]